MSEVIHGRCIECKKYLYITTIDGNGKYVKDSFICPFCSLKDEGINNRFEILDL